MGSNGFFQEHRKSLIGIVVLLLLLLIAIVVLITVFVLKSHSGGQIASAQHIPNESGK